MSLFYHQDFNTVLNNQFIRQANHEDHVRISHTHNMEDDARISLNPKDHKDNVKFKLHVFVIDTYAQY
jgi:hypothetical protein